MKARQISRCVLVMTLALMLLAGTTQAQETSPGTEVDKAQSPGSVQAAIGSAFTYQGRLTQASTAVTGSCDFRFTLWSALTGGSQIGALVSKTNVAVSQGVFGVDLDFGETAFLAGEARWIEVAVRCPAGSGTYTTLAPRQALTTTPYALYARGVWEFPGTGRLLAGTPGGYGPGWIFYSANGERRDIVGDADGLYLGASAGPGAAPYDQLVASRNGNVGIGTYLPTQKLHVVGNRIRLESGGHILDLRADGSAVDVESSTSSIFISSMGAGHHVVINPDAGDGNVGIGTFAPQAKLDVAGTVRCKTVQITGGSDLAEPFDVAGVGQLQPGTVVAIDPIHVGQLRMADTAYDRTVAGCISGAKGIHPGLILEQEGTIADGTLPVALAGRVYCWADASNGAIAPGDLLTTSDTPGHAMRAAELARAQGAILGKAMSSLEQGQGLVLVLVSLQ